MSKVSVIVPIYNVEEYLEACLNSIISQTFREIEIILINDGSTDRSHEIMKRFAEKDKRILIINQQNKGVSVARNRGLLKALGEYLLFVDSDDTILPNTIEILYNQSVKMHCDLLLGDVVYINSNGKKVFPYKRNNDVYNQTLMSGTKRLVKLMEDNTFPPLVYLFFVKRELIMNNQIFFKEGIIHEDELWCINTMLCAKKTSLLDFCYYNYFQRNGSLMNSDNKLFRINSLFVVVKELNKIGVNMKKKGKIDVVGSIYAKIFGLFFMISRLSTEIGEQSFEHKKYFSNLLKDNYHLLSYPHQQACLTSYRFSCIQQRFKIVI
ncbi:MAG: glycosyltransferase [Bacteroidales bacterium]|nr:glycosyltransferase [Bacteroidales bacterium]